MVDELVHVGVVDLVRAAAVVLLFEQLNLICLRCLLLIVPLHLEVCLPDLVRLHLVVLAELAQVPLEFVDELSHYLLLVR